MRVKSSVIRDISHNSEDGDHLFVTFKNGSVYSYEGVTKRKFNSMLKAPSIGQYFAKKIRNQYTCIGPLT